MIRLGGMHYCNSATKFVPDLARVGEQSTLEELTKREGLSSGTCTSARNLDAVLRNLRENSSEGVDYFQELIERLYLPMSQQSAH
eukprot:1016049-Pyramimonas_sp.AAC.1